MANTIPADLIGKIVADLFFQAFTDTLVPLTNFSTDFGGSITKGNKTVSVPVYGAKSSSAFAGDYTANADSTLTDVDVVIDQHLYTSVHITDTEAANSKAANLELMAIQAVQGLALDVMQDVLSVVTLANFGAAIVKAKASFTSDTVVDVKDACDVDKMPGAGRVLLLDDGHYNALLKDTSIKNADHYGSQIAIQAGMIPNLVGFKTFQTGAIPANGENLVGMAAVPSAIAIAMRYLEPQSPQSYNTAYRLQHPETGIVVGVRDFGEAKSGKRYLVFECNYGKAKGGQTGACTRLTSA